MVLGVPMLKQFMVSLLSSSHNLVWNKVDLVPMALEDEYHWLQDLTWMMSDWQ